MHSLSTLFSNFFKKFSSAFCGINALLSLHVAKCFIDCFFIHKVHPRSTFSTELSPEILQKKSCQYFWQLICILFCNARERRNILDFYIRKTINKLNPEIFAVLYKLPLAYIIGKALDNLYLKIREAVDNFTLISESCQQFSLYRTAWYFCNSLRCW